MVHMGAIELGEVLFKAIDQLRKSVFETLPFADHTDY